MSGSKTVKSTGWVIMAGVGLLLAAFIAAPPSEAGVSFWAGVGAHPAGTGDMNNRANWSAEKLPDQSDDAMVVFTFKNNGAPDAALYSTNFVVQNMTVSNITDRILNMAHTDTLLMTNNTVLATNFVMRAVGGANNYALGVTFGSGQFAARNVTFDGAQLGATAGRTTTATLTFGGTSSILSNLTFNGNTGWSLLNLTGPTTIGRDLVFVGGAGTNLLRIAGTTTVSNNVALLNSAGSVSNLVILTGELRVAGNFSNAFASVNKAGFQFQNGTLTFMGGGARIQDLEVASVGTASANNYLIGQVQVGSAGGMTAHVRLVNRNVNNSGTEQLLAGNLSVFAGGTLDVNGLSAAFQTGANAGTIAGLSTPGRGLEVGSLLSNSGTIVLSGGSVLGAGRLYNTGLVSGYGVIQVSLHNAGKVTLGTPGLTFGGVVTNSGLISFGNGVGVFSNFVFNSGTLAVDMSKAYFQQGVTIATDGVLTALAGAELHFRGDFINNSTDNTGFDLLNATVKFDGGGGSNTQIFRVAGLNLGATESGFTNNFAIGEMWVGGSTAIVKLDGDSPELRALYVSTLVVLPDSTLILNGYTIYTWLATIQGTLNTDWGGHVVVIPEPGTVSFVACGVLLLVTFSRSRRRRS